MPNEQNLIPLNKRSKEDAKIIQQKGQAASAAARKARKTARECAQRYLSLPVSELKKWNKLAREGVDAGDINNMMLMIAGAIRAAQDGDTTALKLVLHLIGEDGGEEKPDDSTGVILLEPRKDPEGSDSAGFAEKTGENG